jgi:hypothetical protein
MCLPNFPVLCIRLVSHPSCNSYLKKFPNISTFSE